MPTDKAFAKELNELITRHLKSGSDPQEIVDELTREANLIFAQYNLEIYLVSQKSN